jgi:hypothetical protein
MDCSAITADFGRGSKRARHHFARKAPSAERHRIERWYAHELSSLPKEHDHNTEEASDEVDCKLVKNNNIQIRRAECPDAPLYERETLDNTKQSAKEILSRRIHEIKGGNGYTKSKVGTDTMNRRWERLYYIEGGILRARHRLLENLTTATTPRMQIAAGLPNFGGKMQIQRRK